ncbi:TlpA family protein disulfide reductase [Pedobacter borealis]|uniref:TlpA family protein disulfide reductase n=1 Tax=Pedobacter borealis TaxID=475254 RepID=UPI0004933FBD|nr:TlpA disulfide reductase family protein [Pedobacter borealis]
MQYKKVFLLVCCFLWATVQTFAQEKVNIIGQLTVRKHAEISIVSNVAGSRRVIATYFTNPNNEKFSFSIPFRADATYQIKVVIMKMGHLRLEVDRGATFPLQFQAKQNINVVLNPSNFDEKTGKGIEVERKPSRYSTALLNGTLTNWKYGGDLNIERVVEGRSEKIETFSTEKGGTYFSLLVPVQEEGFYYLSNSRWKKRIYLRPNDQVSLNIDGTSGVKADWTETTPENRVLDNWAQLIEPASHYGYKLEQKYSAILDSAAFSLAYQTLQPKITVFLKDAQTANVKFNQSFKTVAQLDNSLLIMRSLLNLAGKKHLFWLPAKEFSNVPAYYSQVLHQNKISSANLLLLGEGSEYLNLYAKFSLSELSEPKRQSLGDEEKLQYMMNTVSNETLKSFLLKSQLEEFSINNYSEFKQVFLPFAKYAKPESVKLKYNNILEQFAPDTAFIGKSAADFILPDVNGKMVSMKDFKGKVIFIDVWATWCGPCKAQMPFLKEVEQSYQGNNNVVFVGISLDADKDKQKWLGMIKEKELEGVQLLDNIGKSFGRKYKIGAIPRFLLIDKKGNWVEVRCPLPEDKNRLKAYIDRELKKGI